MKNEATEKRESLASSRLWSLWDVMINYNLAGLASQIMDIQATSDIMEVNLLGAKQITSEERNQLKEKIGRYRIVFQSIGSIVLNTTLNDLQRDIDIFDMKAIHYQIEAIKIIIFQELRNISVYLYQHEHASILQNIDKDWAVVFDKFQAAKPDVIAGVDCWAMGQATASVFHMMRVLEYGLEWLASNVGQAIGIENWHTVIERIESSVKNEAASLQRGTARNARLQFLSEAAKEFRYFKDGWRNYVSHARGIYDEHQARSILEHVKTFMLTLANEISDPVV